MATAALVLFDRHDKPSLMLAGQPEEEVSSPSHLTLPANRMKKILGSLVLNLILIMAPYPLLYTKAPHLDYLVILFYVTYKELYLSLGGLLGLCYIKLHHTAVLDVSANH